MKFAKELEQECVPEWRAKYIDYKQGKKRVKAVTRAINRASGTPGSFAQTQRIFKDSPFFSANSPSKRMLTNQDNHDPANPLRDSPAAFGADSRPPSDESSGQQQTVTTPMLMPKRKQATTEPDAKLQYGSFVATPPSNKADNLRLPDPAIATDAAGLQSPRSRSPGMIRAQTSMGEIPEEIRSNSVSAPENAYEVGRTTPPPRASTFGSLGSRRGGSLRRHASNPGVEGGPRPLIRRLFSTAVPMSKVDSKKVDFSLESLHQVRTAEKSFFEWMDKELNKIETFYKSKEDEAEERLKILREQLHEMRNRRIEEITEANQAHELRKRDEHAAFDALKFGDKKQATTANGDSSRPQSQMHAWLEPIERIIDNAKVNTMLRSGSNTQALQNMTRSPEITSHPRDPGHDYVRRPHDHDVPYRSAKRKLKLALKEFYRGLELLKSYALLNRTGFRKINKKYDKAVDAHPPLRYMSEKVNKAWFVQSDVLDSQIHAVEDLYARYFERGNHKLAIGKLRTSTGRSGDYTGTAFRSGILIGTGAVFAIQGVIYATDIEKNYPDAAVRTQTTYLLQIYAGYSLALYLLALFCVNCSIWTRNKINYVFIFEFDPRHHLDWRELAEFPSFLILILGLFMWINFSRYGSDAMYLYYPVILIFVTVLLVFFPGPVLYHRSRRWFVYSHWRLLLAGLYPVEFRDFFLGDMYCSLTYFMSNIELFFCLYAQHPPWSNPTQCNSSHSRLLGFFSTLPGIWRALQCIRRYYDTRAAFPHLANCAKYSMTIMYYVSLSLYRIQNSTALLAIFVMFAAINAIYCSIWDLLMDWSLLQPHANKRFLRDVRGYKSTWLYYIAMVLDIILRFNWVFYVVYTHDLQHSSSASFFIAFSEISRRGMWTLFRVENEHCANVARFKAYRDVPLPYKLDTSSTESIQQPQEENATEAAAAQASPAQQQQPSPILSRYRSRTTAAEAGEAGPGTVRHRAPSRTLTSIVADAHTQDFEKKRKSGVGDSDNVKSLRRDSTSDDEDDRANSSDDDDEEDILDNMHAEDLRRSVER